MTNKELTKKAQMVEALRQGGSTLKAVLGLLFVSILMFLIWQILGYIETRNNLAKVKELKNFKACKDGKLHKEESEMLDEKIDNLTGTPPQATASLILAVVASLCTSSIAIYIFTGFYKVTVAKTD